MPVDLVLLLVGGTAVWIGAEGMVRGAVRLAKYWGVPSLIVGITVVAFGTSAPELVVSAFAALRGHSQIALGNVIGSNIINIGLVLGLSAVISPIHVTREVFRRDIPLVVLVTLLCTALAWIGSEVGRLDGALLLLFFGAHSVMSYRLAMKEQSRVTGEPGWERPAFRIRNVAFLVLGMVLLAIGAEAMIRGAVGVAEDMGMSKRVIGMTIVAFGTSLPELAASVVAARHGESDLALGNVVGSNIYNLLLIMGTAALIRPIQTYGVFGSVEFIFFIGFAVLLIPMGRIGWRFGRVDGMIMLVIYAAFNVLLFMGM